MVELLFITDNCARTKESEVNSERSVRPLGVSFFFSTSSSSSFSLCNKLIDE